MKPNKTVLLVAVVVLIVAGVFVYAYYTGKNGQRMVSDNTNEPLIGGQKDAGGCLIAAGYSWCERKNKCLRIWEEKCYEVEEAALAKVFSVAHNLPLTEAKVTVINLYNDFASGNITFSSTSDQGSGFLARFVNGVWIIDYEGNGSIDCEKIIALGYVQNVLTGFCDVDVDCTEEAKFCPDGSYVSRTGPNCEFALCPGEKQPNTNTLSEAEARAIAEKTCIKGGESLAPGYYNANTQTWWFDANLNATREGCNPACVVSEATQTAEINWRCTSLIEPKSKVSGHIFLGPICAARS